MLKKTMKIFAFTLLLTALPTSANSLFASNVNLDLTGILSVLTAERYSVKNGQTYSEANDPLFHSNGPESQSPQHGYFAVPLIVIGLAGILLYFSKND
jgi:hypothetical protein